MDRLGQGGVVTEAGSYLSLVDSCITQLEAQKPSRTCNESKKKERSQAYVAGFEEPGFAPVHNLPMSSKLETHKPVKARSWPWLEPFSVRRSLHSFKLSPPRPPAAWVQCRSASGFFWGGLLSKTN